VKVPLDIPLEIGFLGPDGRDMPLDLDGTGVLNTPLIELKEPLWTFRFRNVPDRPVVSLNRGFSAPIRLTNDTTLADRLFLMKHDRDPFNRWEAAQTAGRSLIEDAMTAIRSGSARPPVDPFSDALGNVLRDAGLDPGFKAMMLSLPAEAEIATAIGKDIDPDLIRAAREWLREEVGRFLMPLLQNLWHQTDLSSPYSPDPASTARRALRYAVLQAIAGADQARGASIAGEVLSDPQSMTDEIGALSSLILVDRSEREAALDQFYQRHQRDHLLVDKWFSLEASVPFATTPRRVRELMHHRDFKLTTPNRVRSLVGTFAMGNFVAFNAADGEGYAIVADTIISLDPLNPQVAARLTTAFRSWQMLEADRRALAEAALRRILETPRLSRDTFEIVSKSLVTT
jgi:aminopeptidase N